MCPILALDRHTISSIHSGQVITSIESIVKELLENSLDAKANNIDIRLVDDGLDTVEIRDDGSGITKTDCCNMARRHHTSKLTTFSDLDNISTYGFRGEALSSICELAEEVYITTKTEQDKVATCYKLDRKGGIKSENTAGTMYRSGTMVSIHRPFVNLPVRRQVAEKARTISIKRIQELAIKYGLSHPFLRLSLHQLHSTLGQLRKQPTWVKPSTSSLLEGVRIIYDSTLASMVEECSLEESFDQQLEPDVTSSPQPIRLHCLLPSKLSDPSYIFKGDRVFIYVNKRPINYAKSDLKEMVAMVRRRYKRTLDLDDDVRKVPFMYIDVQTGFGDYDVNIEPDKSVVMLLHKDRILTLFEDLLDRIYGSFFSQNRQNEVLENTSYRDDNTYQEVPSQSPRVIDFDHAQSPTPHHIQSSTGFENQYKGDYIDVIPPATHALISNDDRLQESDEYDELVESDNELDRSLHTTNTTGNPLSLNGWLDGEIHNNIEIPSYTSNLSPTKTARPEPQNAHSSVGSGTDMNWQIDNRSDHSTTVVRHNLQQDIDQNPTPLSNWFAQYRRKSTNKFNNSKRSSSVKDYDSLSSNVAQAKRPRVQLELPFDFERTSSSVSPSTVLPTTVAHTNSNNRILLAPSSLQSLSTDTTIGRFDETSMETSTTRQNTDIFGSPSNSSNRRRDIAALFAKSLSSPSSSAQNLQIDTGLSHTLNEIITFDLASSSMEDIRKNYSFHRERHTQFHRRSIAEYCQQTTSAIDQQEPTLQSLYLENKMKIIFCAQRVRTDLGWVMKKLEAIDMTQLKQRYRFQRLMSDYELKCGKALDKPVQINVSDSDPLHSTILSLDKREQQIVNDGHDTVEYTYSIVTDRRIIANGFRVRWRKELYSHDLVIQFTSISDLNGFGPSDFLEVLGLIQQQMERQQRDSDNNWILNKVRPTKLIDYFKILAKNEMPTFDPPPSNDWRHMMASLDQEIQDRFITKAGKPLTYSLI